MKKVFFAAIAIMVAVPAMAKMTKNKKKSKSTHPIESVTMRRTACYGRCPDYSIEIKSDGSIIYTGFRFVTDSGEYKKNIGTAKALMILNKLHSNKVDTCRGMYENRIPDLPGIYYTLKYKDSTKKIFNANFGPEFLKETAVEMDELGLKHNKSWTKSKVKAKSK